MNLVAHQFLSFNNPSLQIGNLLGEVVKGNKYNDYPEDIKKGILLHRAIDTFTDQHDVVKKSTSYFHDSQNKYAPILVDLLYDYILIKQWNKYNSKTFESFTSNCYELFHLNYDNFPHRLQHMLDYLLKHDWFNNYSTLDGIQLTLSGISKRTTFDNNLPYALATMKKYEEEIENDFNIFFPELIAHCKDFIDNN